MRDESDTIIDPSKRVSPTSPEKLDESSSPSNLEKMPAIKISRRESASGESQKDTSTSAATAIVKETQKLFEEEDSLHGATTDLGGTTIPA